MKTRTQPLRGWKKTSTPTTNTAPEPFNQHLENPPEPLSASTVCDFFQTRVSQHHSFLNYQGG